MKFTLVFCLSFFIFSNIAKADWGSDLEKARKEAKASGKMILLNFAGSDWCIPCIKMKKEIFEHQAFMTFADANLILVKADFPRLKKNQLSKEQTKANKALAAKYNKSGAFPFTLLIDAEGKVIKSWDGMVKGSCDDFVNDLKKASK
jgi:thioredoxin-related protein